MPCCHCLEIINIFLIREPTFSCLTASHTSWNWSWLVVKRQDHAFPKRCPLMQWLLLTITWLNILKIYLCECVLAHQTSFLSDHYNRAKKWLPCDMFDITGFYIPQRNLSSLKIKGSALFEDLQHFQKTCPHIHLLFWSPGQRKFWREALWKYEKKHCGNIINESINPTNISDAYEVGARHSLAHWGSNHEQDTPGPCPPQSPSLVEEIGCYKRCCEEEVLSVIVAKPNLGLLTHMQLSQSTDARLWRRKVQLL